MTIMIKLKTDSDEARSTQSTFTTASADGKRLVRTTEQNGRFSSRLYVNSGETATLTTRKATTRKGAQKQIGAMLAGL